MKALRKYDIDIFMLSNEKHEYEMEVDKEFFELFEDSFVEKGKGKVHVELDKTETMIQVVLTGKGDIELVCDRSLENFDHPFDFSEKIIFKYGEEADEIDDGLYIITKGTQKINLAKEIYDYIGLSIPMKKLHPRFQNEEGVETDHEIEGKLVYTSIDTIDDENSDKHLNIKEESEDIDPRWNILKKLKDNNNNLN